MLKEGLNKKSKRIITVSFVFYLVVIIFLSLFSNTNFALVFIGTIPLLLYMIAFFLIYTHKNIGNKIIWILPLVFPVIFYYIWMADLNSLISRMEGLEVAVMNILFSYALNIFLLLIYKIPTKERVMYVKEKKLTKQAEQQAEYQKQQTEYHKQRAEALTKEVEKYKAALQITKNNFQVNLRGIEDKCKALNFVIGRVYSTKRGGNKTIRDTLKIDKELYNKFSELTAEFDASNAKKLLTLLNKLYAQFQSLELTEKEVIKKTIHSNERIIDILDKQDKDPAHEYFFEAKEVCEKIINYLKETYGI